MRITRYIRLGIIIELRHSGIIRIGFHTTGAPNTIGSLILKIAGKDVYKRQEHVPYRQIDPA